MEERFDELKDYLELVQGKVEKDVKKWKSKDEFKIRKNTLLLGGAVIFLLGVIFGVCAASNKLLSSGKCKCGSDCGCGSCGDEEESCCCGEGCCK